MLMARIFLKKDKPLKARFLIETGIGLSSKDEEAKEMLQAISGELENDEKKLLQQFKPDLDQINEILKKKKTEDDQVAELYKSIAEKLYNEGR